MLVYYRNNEIKDASMKVLGCLYCDDLLQISKRYTNKPSYPPSMSAASPLKRTNQLKPLNSGCKNETLNNFLKGDQLLITWLIDKSWARKKTE